MLRSAALACVVLLALTGCGDDSEEPDAGHTVDPTPSSSAPADAEEQIARGTLPPGFPRNDVPLLEEGLVGGAKLVDQFVVTFQPGNIERAEKQAVRLLTAAGYRTTDQQQGAGTSSTTLTKGRWQVRVGASRAGIIYIVAPV